MRVPVYLGTLNEAGIMFKSGISIDIETLSCADDAIVLSVGWCFFEFTITSGRVDISDISHYRLSIREQIDSGRTMDPETVAWHFDHQIQALKSLPNSDPSTISAMVNQLELFYDRCTVVEGTGNHPKIKPEGYTGVWVNGMDFDIPILRSLFQSIGMGLPWYFREAKDVRTIRGINGWEPSIQKSLGEPSIQKSLGERHSAAADAVFQAVSVALCLGKHDDEWPDLTVKVID